MWRIWTRGWGPRDWWFWFKDSGFPMWFAWALPRYLAYWTYIRVHTASNDGASDEAIATMKAWEAGAGK